MRKVRNNSKYYGKEISFDKLNEQINNFNKIRDILKKELE